MHDASSFITLTYDKKNLPLVGGRPTLSKEDCQLFMKRLRKELEPKRVRFFLCGEYGEKMGRPHYHAVIFGEAFADRKPLASSGDYTRWTSEKLTEIWGKGRTEGGDVSFDSAVYVANYATKKIIGKDAAKHYDGRTPEFLLMSRGGKDGKGIGFGFIDKFGPEVWARDEIIVRGQKARPPRYYDKILEAHNPQLLESIKAERRLKSEILEEFTTPLGTTIRVTENRNPYRLKVRETVARAKLALKRRDLEKYND